MSRMRILLARSDFHVEAIDRLKKSFDVFAYSTPLPMPRADLLAKVSGVHGVLISVVDKIDAEFMDAAGPSLKVIVTPSVGYDHIDVKEAKKRGIKVGTVQNLATNATADLTVGLLLAAARRIVEGHANIHSGKCVDPSFTPASLVGRGLTDSTVGIFGLGKIGLAVLKRLAGFGVSRFLYNSNSEKQLDPSLPAAEFVSFESLVRESDFVVCTAALTDATRHKFDRQAFTAMKNSAIFVNVARGGLVDQEALVWALKSGQIQAAGLDVMTPEPLPPTDPLNSLVNCVMVPHIGVMDDHTWRAIVEMTMDNLVAGLTDKEMPHQLC